MNQEMQDCECDCSNVFKMVCVCGVGLLSTNTLHILREKMGIEGPKCHLGGGGGVGGALLAHLISFLSTIQTGFRDITFCRTSKLLKYGCPTCFGVYSCAFKYNIVCISYLFMCWFFQFLRVIHCNHQQIIANFVHEVLHMYRFYYRCVAYVQGVGRISAYVVHIGGRVKTLRFLCIPVHTL